MSTIGPKIILEGEKEYRKAIADVNSSMRVLKSELKAVSAEYDGNANSVEALRKKNEALSKQQSEQEKIVRLLQGALAGSTKEYGENSRQAQNWQVKLNNAVAELNKMNNQLQQNEKYLNEAESSTEKVAKSIDEYGKEVKEAADQTKVFGDVFKANILSDMLYDGIRKLGDAMADMVKDGIGLASNLQEVQNVVDVTFGGGADDVDRWAKSIDNAFGMSELKGKEFAGTFGAMLKSADITGNELIETTKKVIERTGDLTSFYNSDLPNAFTKTRSLVTGETEPLKQWGINMSVANLEAYALKEGLGKLYSEMENGEQIMTRINYFLSATADAQGDFARNIDSLANQQRIAELQREEALTKLGNAILPEVTRATMKFNEAMDGMGDDLTEVAAVLADGIVDALVWIIDNADTIIAGLKGITAAVVTKKTADGVGFLINAYKTLTTTTQAATGAQIAFNTASKANIYVALASVVVGLATTLFSYAKSAKEAAEETDRLSEATRELVDNSSKAREEIESRIGKWDEETKSIETQHGAISILTDKLYTLAGKESKTNLEKELMISLVKELNEAIPELNLNINEQTGALSKQKDEVEALIAKNKEYYLVKAAEENYTKIAEQRARAEMELNDLQDQKNMKLSQLLELRRQLVALGGIEGQEAEAWNVKKYEIDNLNASIRTTIDDIGALSGELFGWNQIFNESEDAWRRNEEYIKKYSSSLGEAGSSIEEFSKKYQDLLESQTETEIGTLEDRQARVTKLYEGASKELEKRLKAEEKALTKSQEKRTEAVEKAQEKELTVLEESHQKKLELLNEEYLAKIKTVDEDRYNELMEVEKEIALIENQQEAEERAIEERENAEQKAELRIRVENAKTAEERLTAQRDLAKFEEKIARDRLKSERKLQKEVLTEQKKAINEKYDIAVKALEDEQKEEQEKLKENLTAEKDNIKEKHKLRKESLKDELELERENLKDRQSEYRNYLKEQRSLAQTNAKKIYEDDLAQYKLNQALKYDEAMSSEAQMKKAIKEYAYKHMSPGRERETLLKSNDLNEMLKYYNPSALIKTPTVKTAQSDIDYSLMADVFKSSLKGMKIELNGNEVGQFVETKINAIIRR